MSLLKNENVELHKRIDQLEALVNRISSRDTRSRCVSLASNLAILLSIHQSILVYNKCRHSSDSFSRRTYTSTRTRKWTIIYRKSLSASRIRTIPGPINYDDFTYGCDARSKSRFVSPLMPGKGQPLSYQSILCLPKNK